MKATTHFLRYYRKQLNLNYLICFFVHPMFSAKIDECTVLFESQKKKQVFFTSEFYSPGDTSGGFRIKEGAPLEFQKKCSLLITLYTNTTNNCVKSGLFSKLLYDLNVSK